jgi:hypothetical protein
MVETSLPRGSSGRQDNADAPRTKKELSVQMPVASAEMYRGILGDITLAAAPTTEADPVGILASLLAAAGVLAGQSPHVRIGNTRHPLLVYPLLFGRTGSGRKGEATDTAETFLRSYRAESPELFASGLSTGEGLIERIRDTKDQNDAGGTEDKRLLLTETEFSAVMARGKRDNNTLLTVIRQAWEGRALSVLNRSTYRASTSHVGIIGHIAPREFRTRLAESEMAGGTYNRFLPFFVERPHRIPLPEALDEESTASLSRKLEQSVLAASDCRLIQLDREATRLWCDELYDEFTGLDEDEAAWTQFTERAAPYARRISALFAALDGRALVDVKDLAAAAALVRYSIASARYVLDGQARDPRLDRIRRAVDAAGDAGLSRTEISGLFSRNIDKTVLDALLDALTEEGSYGAYEAASSGGRPATRYRRTNEGSK